MLKWFFVHLAYVANLHLCVMRTLHMYKGVTMRRYNTNGDVTDAETKTSVKGADIAPLFTVLYITISISYIIVVKKKLVQNKYNYQ